MSVDIDKQNKVKDFVSQNVHANQTMLVEDLLAKEMVELEDIENYYKYTCPDCGHERINKFPISDETSEMYCPDCNTTIDDMLEPEAEPQEIYEWWLVNNWLLEKLEAKGETILRSNYENWWGRGCTGQAIALDGVIEEIYDDLQGANLKRI